MTLTESQIKILKIGVPIFVGLVVIAIIIGIVISKSKASTDKRDLGDTSKEKYVPNPQTIPPVQKIYTETEWSDIIAYPLVLVEVLPLGVTLHEWIDMVKTRNNKLMFSVIKTFNSMLDMTSLDKLAPQGLKYSDILWNFLNASISKGPVFTQYVPTELYNKVISDKNETKMNRIAAIGVAKKQLSDDARKRGGQWV
jgi:hypothetical protein